MPIRAVLFDWDGTIVRDAVADPDAGPDLFAASLAAANYAGRHMNATFTAEDFERAFHAAQPKHIAGETTTAPAMSSILASAFAWLGVNAASRDIDVTTRIFSDSGTRGQEVYDDARMLLPSLNERGYRMAVVTNSPFTSDFVDRKAKSLGIAHYFDAVISSADVGLAKPHPGIFQRALAAVDTDPHEALFVGDTVNTDIAGARAAGMRAILIERSLRSHAASGYLVIERLGALDELLGER